MLLLILCACGGGGAAPVEAPAPLPLVRPPPPAGKTNVLFLMLEDQGPQMGAYGTRGVITPNMDALAALGARYERMWVTMGLCTTSKGSILTGHYNQLMGVLDNVPDFVGSPEALAAANPDWYSNHSSIYYQYAIPNSVPTLIEVLWNAGYYLGLQNKFHQSPHRKFPYDHWYEPNYGSSYQEVTDFITEAKASGRPWFLMHNIPDSHRPWPDSSGDPRAIDPASIDPPGHLPDTPTVRTDYSEYFIALRRADARVGQALQALRDSGEAGHTMIVYMGDNGIEYHRGKYSAYNMGLQVPLMFVADGVAPGSLRHELASGVDVMPTLLDFLGVTAPAGMQGFSHYALLTGASSTPPRQYLLGNNRSDRSITDGHFQLTFMPEPGATTVSGDLKLPSPWRNLVYNHIVDNADTPGFETPYRLLDLADATLTRFERPRFELHDLVTDPWQINDLAGDPAYATQFNTLRAELRHQMQALGDSNGGLLP